MSRQKTGGGYPFPVYLRVYGRGPGETGVACFRVPQQPGQACRPRTFRGVRGEGLRLPMSKSDIANTPRKVFISYSHKDEGWKNKLLPPLKALEQAGVNMVVWEDPQSG